MLKLAVEFVAMCLAVWIAVAVRFELHYIGLGLSGLGLTVAGLSDT